MVTRLLAYCLEYQDGIAFSEGVSSTDEPAVLERDPTGAVTVWIEVGAPDVARLHHGSKLADKVVVYTHRDPTKVSAVWHGKKIHQAEEIVLRSFDPGFIDGAVVALGRGNTITISVTENQLYLNLNDAMLMAAMRDEAIC